MIWVAGRSPTLVSHSLRGVATNLKATTLTYLAIKSLFSYPAGKPRPLPAMVRVGMKGGFCAIKK
jgi:hypothetical protein